MTQSTRRQYSKTPLPSTLKLAHWQLRQSWGLFLITGVGIVAAVMLVCAVPLYAKIAMSAGLRGVLTTSPQNAEIVVRGNSRRISEPLIKHISDPLNREFSKYLGPYLTAPQFSIETPPYTIFSNQPVTKGPRLTNNIGLISAPGEQAGSHLQLLQGRLPQSNGNALELAITAETAAALHATVGSSLKIGVAFSDANQTVVQRELMLRVVGIFKLTSANDPFWHGNDFTIYKPSDFVTTYRGLVSNQALLTTMTRISDQAASKGLFLYTATNLIWYYRFDPTRIAIDDLDTILNGLTTIKVDNGNNSDFNQSPFIDQVLTYQQSDILAQYRNRTSVAQLPMDSLLLLMLGLVLFFISMMADLLVDRQADTIAILRSRGASRRQVFTSLMIQCVGLGLVALIIGPLLTLYLVRFIAQQALTATDQGALNLIAGNPVQGAIELGGYAILAVVTTIAAMTFAINQAIHRDMLSVRREAARSTRRPLWLQLNLDIIAALLALVGYVISLYFTNTGALDAHLRLLLLSPLTLLESAFLLIAGILIFLRFFPRILRFGTWLALRSRSSTPMLALAQLARSPRQPVRMTLLLALTTAFAIFTLIFTASQSQRVLDVAAYQGGADFSGTIPINILTLAQMSSQTTAYQHIHGVKSVSLGYVTPATAGGGTLTFPVNFTAVDTSTYGQTAIWTAQDASQPLPALMNQLATQRTAAISHKVVPAIVDDAAWSTLHLSPGANFALNFASGDYNDLVNFTAIARVDHIPTSGDSILPGIMVDYRAYVAVYTHNYASTNFIVPLNYAWLRTADDATSLASVRNALSQGDLYLDPLFDRRALINTLYHEPLYLSLTGILALGAIMALLLAMVGNLIASWLSARHRLTNFAILRALGASPGQVVSTLSWEQGIIYAAALGLGILFGLIFSVLVIPGLVFTSVAPSGVTSGISSSTFYGIQSVPPIQIILPGSLGIALALLLALCILALIMMVQIVSRTSISQALRLNED
ncbi:MAG TPA: FtsX-like permease family protein [Ktedonobacteraceae bacterium]|nr:FtsX-like permease family protein [Ktedonobacteraceae bacterium]